MTEDTRPINEYDTQTFPNDNYKRLFIAVSQTNGMPTIEDLKGIVDIVREDIITNDKKNY